MTESFQILATLIALRIALAMTPTARARGDLTGLVRARSRGPEGGRVALCAALGALGAEILVAIPALALADLATALPEGLAVTARVAAGLWLAVACIGALRRAWDEPIACATVEADAVLGRTFGRTLVDRLAEPETFLRALALFVVTGAGAVGTPMPIAAVAVGGLIWSLVVIAVSLPAPRPRLDHHFAGGHR